MSSHAVKHGLQYYAITTMIVAGAVLLILVCISWGLKCWEQRRIIAHYQREEKAATAKVQTFSETFREGEFKRTGVEIVTRKHSLRIGWLGGEMPTFFFIGRLSNRVNQIRVWRFAVSHCANDERIQS